jgi:hypothetical protein
MEAWFAPRRRCRRSGSPWGTLIWTWGTSRPRSTLDALVEKGYYIIVEKKNYKFSLKENLNKRFTDKKASVKTPQAEELVKQEIQKVFTAREGLDRVFFPDKSLQISDRPVITFIIGDLNHTMEDRAATLQWADKMTKECGTSSRTYKSALIWVTGLHPDEVEISDDVFLIRKETAEAYEAARTTQPTPGWTAESETQAATAGATSTEGQTSTPSVFERVVIGQPRVKMTGALSQSDACRRL